MLSRYRDWKDILTTHGRQPLVPCIYTQEERDMGRYCYGRGWQWTHPYHIVTNIFTVTTSAALQNSRTPSNKICVGGGVGDEYDNKIFFSNLDDVLKCQPSPHCTERGCKVFRRKNDSTIGDVRPSSSKTTLHFQTQKRLYNCRCLSVIITFFKIFSRKNDSTFVNVRSWSSLSSKLIILINWKKFSSHLSVFSDAIKGRLQKKKKEGRGLMRKTECPHFQTFILWMR